MSEADRSGATAVIAHRIRDSQHERYEEWLREILPLVSEAPGFLDVQVIRPVRGLTDTYTVILRFDCEADLKGWLGSSVRQRLIDTVRPVLAQGDSYTVHSGIDFLFAPHDGSQRTPPRWKQFLVTWTAILPLTLLLPLLIAPALQALGWHNRFVIRGVVSAVAVLLMVYLIMPRYTRLVRRWLFR